MTNNTIYLMGYDHKYGFASAEAFLNHGYHFKDVVTGNNFDQQVPDGDVIK